MFICQQCQFVTENKQAYFCHLGWHNHDAKRKRCLGSIRGANVEHQRAQKRKASYEQNPTLCVFCGTPLSYRCRKGKFCSHSCSAKQSNANRLGYLKTPELKILVKLPGMSIQRLNQLLTSNWEELSSDSRKFRVLIEQMGKCHKCGISHWNGERLTMEIEHCDGNHSNNARSNVVCLCPNCHSQTPTWRGRKNRIGLRSGILHQRLDLLLPSLHFNAPKHKCAGGSYKPAKAPD